MTEVTDQDSMLAFSRNVASRTMLVGTLGSRSEPDSMILVRYFGVRFLLDWMRRIFADRALEATLFLKRVVENIKVKGRVGISNIVAGRDGRLWKVSFGCARSGREFLLWSF